MDELLFVVQEELDAMGSPDAAPSPPQHATQGAAGVDAAAADADEAAATAAEEAATNAAEEAATKRVCPQSNT